MKPIRVEMKPIGVGNPDIEVKMNESGGADPNSEVKTSKIRGKTNETGGANPDVEVNLNETDLLNPDIEVKMNVIFLFHPEAEVKMLDNEVGMKVPRQNLVNRLCFEGGDECCVNGFRSLFRLKHKLDHLKIETQTIL